jgi:dTDP-4-dehydrorhamnose reductase
MKRVLILGGGGMLGHKVWQVLRPRHDAVVTLRADGRRHEALGLFDRDRTIAPLDVSDAGAVAGVIVRVRPDVVVNCVGVVKQLPEARDAVVSITLNSLLPHQLAVACRDAGARLIHISTDCVFSGDRGAYRETDKPDATDLYGRSKCLGEVSSAPGLTLRTSIIGRELSGTKGLVEWFLSNRGHSVRGYERAIFSGLTTGELALLLSEVIENHPDLSGLYHVSADAIDKMTLLRLLNESYAADVMIEPSSEVAIDRSLDSSRFRETTGWHPKSWPEMIHQMASDRSPYDEWRRALTT